MEHSRQEATNDQQTEKSEPWQDSSQQTNKLKWPFYQLSVRIYIYGTLLVYMCVCPTTAPPADGIIISNVWQDALDRRWPLQTVSSTSSCSVDSVIWLLPGGDGIVPAMMLTCKPGADGGCDVGGGGGGGSGLKLAIVHATIPSTHPLLSLVMKQCPSESDDCSSLNALPANMEWFI